MSTETFQSRLKGLVGDKYNSSMRRSIQAVALYEADRCLSARYKALRPFQRKIALYDCAMDLVNTLDFLQPFHKMEIMFRTATGKVPLSPDLAWRRMKLIDRDIKKTIIPNVKPFMAKDKSHQEACNEYIQSQYEQISKNTDKTAPEGWEHAHINIFLAYRMYYDGENIASDLPPATDPNQTRVVPNNKPEVYPPPMQLPKSASAAVGAMPGAVDGYGSDDLKAFASQIASGGSPKKGGGKRKRASASNLAEEVRRAQLKEVKDHFDILKEMEGIIPPAEMEERKKALWAAMPPPPGAYSGGGKKKAAVTTVGV